VSYDAIIAGAGPAGSSLAILLAEQGFSVLLAEAKPGPAHKLCGEFLSPESRALFDDLGIAEDVRAAGAVSIGRLHLSGTRHPGFDVELEEAALGLSRFAFDALLVNAAARAGAEVRYGSAVQEVEGSFEDGFRVRIGDAEYGAGMVFGAYGRAGVLDRKLGRDPGPEPSGLVGFKAHFEGDGPVESIEMHAFNGGYCGLSPVEGGRTNVCWLARVDCLREDGGSPEDMMTGSMRSNARLQERLRGLKQVTDFSAVAQVSLRARSRFEGDVCMVGDAAAMIAPFCGDGMAMAMQTARMVARLSGEMLHGHLSATRFREAYEAGWRRHFSRRLVLGRILHAVFSRHRLAGFGIRTGSAVPAVTRWFIRHTRG
jgi:menaquinone-9 beta-reductase